MSAATQTRIFGIRLGVDPKFLVGGLIGLAALLFWYNSRGEEDTSSTTRTSLPIAAPVAIGKTRASSQRRRATRDDRGTLRLRAVDPTRGDVDPVLRLDLLARLSNVHPPAVARNLFETGPATPAEGAAHLPVRSIIPQPVPPPVAPQNTVPAAMTANIPLKYYGFAKPANQGEANRGFFLEGDNIVVAIEGQLIQQRYLVVQLTAANARLEDTQIKLGQTIAVVPEAQGQPGMNLGLQQQNQGMMNQGAVEEP